MAAALGLYAEEVLDLSVSLNPVAPDLLPLVAAHLEDLRRYPDPTRATVLLAEAMGVDPSSLLLTNGGAESIALVAAEIGGRAVEPDFSLYPRDTSVATGDSPIWRSNPHNPSGLLAVDTDEAGVWDEAFFPLATGRWTRGDPGAVVVGSLTKLLALPGMRLGYLLGDPDLVERCKRRQPEWSVGSIPAAALPEMLSVVDLAKWSKEVAELREELVAVLRTHGLEPRPSDANWVLVDSPGLRERLAPRGVVVRDCSSFGLGGVARVAVPSPEGLEVLDAALSATSDRSGGSRSSATAQSAGRQERTR